jgi:hypothetical protein
VRVRVRVEHTDTLALVLCCWHLYVYALNLMSIAKTARNAEYNPRVCCVSCVLVRSMLSLSGLLALLYLGCALDLMSIAKTTRVPPKGMLCVLCACVKHTDVVDDRVCLACLLCCLHLCVCVLDLMSIAKTARNAEYNPKVFHLSCVPM